MSKIPFGPTYDEMLNPNHQDPEVRKAALKAKQENELDPINLFNITWKNEKNEVNKIVLPKELTGVDANIVVLLGKYFLVIQMCFVFPQMILFYSLETKDQPFLLVGREGL